MSRVFSHVLENVGECAGNNASIGIPLSTSRDREGLARSCLPISKNGAVVALEASIDHILGDFLKNTLLLCQHVEDASEAELVVVVFDLSVAKSITLEVEFDFAVIGGQGQTRVRLLRRANSEEHLNALLLGRHEILFLN